VQSGGGGDVFLKKNLPMLSKACGHSYNPKTPKNLRAVLVSMCKVGETFFSKKIAHAVQSMQSLVQSQDPKEPSRSLNQRVQGGEDVFLKKNLPMLSKACGHSYNPKTPKNLRAVLICMCKVGKIFFSKRICPCCPKHAVTRTIPSPQRTFAQS